MPDLTTIQDKINQGKLYYIEQATEILTKMKQGYGDTKPLRSLGDIIQALSFQVDAELNSDTTVSLYYCLIKILAGFSGTYVLDPNVVIPGQTTIVLQQVVGYNSNKIFFDTTNENPSWILSDYHTLYYPLYGNNPSLAIYNNQGQYVGDEQTPPTIVYQDNNPSLDILSITYDYPVGTAGFILISGVAPNSGGSGTGGGGGATVTTLTFSQADLLDAGGGNWYLPLNIGVNQNPIFTTVDDESISTTYDKNPTPHRLYGFANNSTQVIKVTII